MKRPGTITAAFIITLLDVISSLVLGGIALAGAAALADGAPFTDATYSSASWGVVISMALSVILLLIAIAMFRGSNGARITLIVLQVLALIGWVLQLFGEKTGSGIAGAIIDIVLSVIVIALLLSNSAKQFCTQGRAARTA